jgi:hypothetical protein
MKLWWSKIKADWQQMMQEPREDLEARATERAVKAGDAAAKSDRHVSKQRLAEASRANRPNANQRREIAQLRKAHKDRERRT